MRSLYWKIYYALQQFHFRKYRRQAPGIYYDRRYRVWVWSKDTTMFSRTLLDVVDDAFWVGLCFPFYQDGEDNHVHSFDELLDYAYNSDAAITIPDEYKQYYSAQELKVIQVVNARGAIDRKLPNKHVDI